ncbi:MAG: ABC transporter ATP-binding protein [Burkholderiaceae bacterium]|nr:ABC transporter ATP-binding protein [Burkholderiaceae bacterium]MCD8537819.1 ABC transporter ATP-binding protein [Burkholderiaceae bacterium]
MKHNQDTTSFAPLLTLDHLRVDFQTRHGVVHAVQDISLSLSRGETLGIVGESGSGKSVTSYALMGLLDRAGRVTSGRAVYSGIDLLPTDESTMRDIRGREISMIFQNPRAALNPIRTVGDQIADVLLQHNQCTRQNARSKAIEALANVQIRNPDQRVDAYPFELSGGMCQRVVIAMALACKPRILIADEPTTGLDVTTQRAVMELVRELTRQHGMASILITHDLGLAGEYCDRVAIMQKGVIVEAGPAAQIFQHPTHPYTRKLVKATPHSAQSVLDLLPADSAGEEITEDKMTLVSQVESMFKQPLLERRQPVLQVQELRRSFVGKRTFTDMLARRPARAFEAVKGISFDIWAGESVGLVGESGCGKSTTSSMIMRLLDPTDGAIRFKGQDITLIRRDAFVHHPTRRTLQMVFQDPTDSLNPRFSAADSIADPLRRLVGLKDKAQIDRRVHELAQMVGLPSDLLTRLPHQLSGGQKARVGIARAIATEPDLLILDEPTAALDVSVQAIVLNLLVDLRMRTGMAYLFVSHDLEVVRLLCDRIIVMRAGEIVEQGPTAQVLASPVHAYTRELLAAAPRPPSEHRQDQEFVHA